MIFHAIEETNERLTQCHGLISAWGETFLSIGWLFLLDQNVAFRKSHRYNWPRRFDACLRKYAACCSQRYDKDI
jgi:hypothetical protein